MKVIHYLEKKYGLLAIQNQRLKVALYEDLNDPFELFGASTDDRYTRDGLRHLKQDFNNQLGLLCFSKTWQNPVMWSHYADRHKGIALEFEVPEELLIEMKYRSSRKSASLEKSISSPEKSALVNYLLETKYLHWKYEKEMRMHVKHNETTLEEKLRFYKFGDTLKLKRLFLGPLCDVSDSEIKKILPKGKQVQVINTRLAFKTFRVVFQKSKQKRIVKSNN